MGDQISKKSWKKNLENCTSPFLPENFLSPHQLTLERAEAVVVDPLSQNFASALRSSTFGSAGLSMKTVPRQLGPSCLAFPFRRGAQRRGETEMRVLSR